MAAYFTLTPKGATAPQELTIVDETICIVFNSPVDPRDWYLNWYNVIGFALAMGQTFAQIHQELASTLPELLPVVDFLASHYEVDSWRQ